MRSSDILMFVHGINESHYVLTKEDIPPLTYWDAGNVYGIDLYGNHLWDSEEGDFSVKMLKAKVDGLHKLIGSVSKVLKG